jgi:hypothetical protein
MLIAYADFLTLINAIRRNHCIFITVLECSNLMNTMFITEIKCVMPFLSFLISVMYTLEEC